MTNEPRRRWTCIELEIATGYKAGTVLDLARKYGVGEKRSDAKVYFNDQDLEDLLDAHYKAKNKNKKKAGTGGLTRWNKY